MNLSPEDYAILKKKNGRGLTPTERAAMRRFKKKNGPSGMRRAEKRKPLQRLPGEIVLGVDQIPQINPKN